MTEKISPFKMRGKPWIGCEYEPTIETVRIANAIAGWYMSGEGCQTERNSLAMEIATAMEMARHWGAALGDNGDAVRREHALVERGYTLPYWKQQEEGFDYRRRNPVKDLYAHQAGEA